MAVPSFTRPSCFLNPNVVFSKGFTVVPTKATLVAAMSHGNATPAAPTRDISAVGAVGDAQGLIVGTTSGVPGADSVLAARETSQLVDARRQNATLLSNAEIARKALFAERKFTTETSLASISREKKLQERVDELQKSNAHELQTQLNLARMHIEKLQLDIQDAKTLKQLLIASSQVGMLVGAHVKTSSSDGVIPLVFRGKMCCLVELIPPTLADGPLPLWVCQFLSGRAPKTCTISQVPMQPPPPAPQVSAPSNGCSRARAATTSTGQHGQFLCGFCYLW